jgi:hypothetical protein
VNPNSSLTVNPRTTTQYTLTCTNPGKPPLQAGVTVTVSQNPGLHEIAP